MFLVHGQRLRNSARLALEYERDGARFSASPAAGTGGAQWETCSGEDGASGKGGLELVVAVEYVCREPTTEEQEGSTTQLRVEDL